MSEWLEMPPEEVEKLRDVLERESPGGKMRILAVLAVRACRLHYPEVKPQDIGPDGVQVRWIHDSLRDTFRVRYRFAPSVVERFGEPVAQKVITADNHGRARTPC